MLDAKIREYILTKPEYEEPENLDVTSRRLSASVNIFTCTAIFSTLLASSSSDMEASESEISGMLPANDGHLLNTQIQSRTKCKRWFWQTNNGMGNRNSHETVADPQKTKNNGEDEQKFARLLPKKTTALLYSPVKKTTVQSSSPLDEEVRRGKTCKC
nr:hypothetical protein Iba_chr05cCG2750 [Ipomoea batatas]